MKRSIRILFVLALLGVSFGSGNGAGKAAAATPLHEISYYPQKYAWEEFWLHWADAKPDMDKDLDLIQGLGANTVRIFLHPLVMGYPTPTPAMLANFADALELIAAHGLKAHVNLFDCSEPYADINGSKAWLSTVVTPHKNDPRIAIWELRNEVGLDQAVIRAWVQALLPDLKQQAGDTLVTVSVRKAEWLDDLVALAGTTQPDLYSLHLYLDRDFTWTPTFPAILDGALRVVPKEKLLIGEFGLSMYEYSEADQSDLYTNVLYYAHQRGIDNLGAWTLYDFPEGTLVCGAPDPVALYFGLYRRDGTERPAAAVVRAAFHGSWPALDRPARLYNPSFELLKPNSQQLDNWRSWDQYWTKEYRAVQDPTVARQGCCSAHLVGPENLAVGLFNHPPIEVYPALRYNLEAYVRTENLAGWAHVSITWLDKAGDEITYAIGANLTTANQTEWTRLSIQRAAPPANAASAQVFVQMQSSRADTKVWFDDVKFWAMDGDLPLVVRGR